MLIPTYPSMTFTPYLWNSASTLLMALKIRQPPYLLSQKTAWGASFSGCCFINDGESEILRNEEMVNWQSDATSICQESEAHRDRKALGRAMGSQLLHILWPWVLCSQLLKTTSPWGQLPVLGHHAVFSTLRGVSCPWRKTFYLQTSQW